MFPIFSSLGVVVASRWRGGWIDLQVAFHHPGQMDGLFGSGDATHGARAGARPMEAGSWQCAEAAR